MRPMIKKLLITDRQNNKRELKDFFDHEIGTRLEWEYGQTRSGYSLENSDKFLTALSPSKKEIIILQGGTSSTTDTLKIINGDGTVKFNLRPPRLTSDQFKKFEDKVGESKAFETLRYVQLGEKVSETTITVWVGFNYDWFDVKELNLVTGEFGDSKMTGRL